MQCIFFFIHVWDSIGIHQRVLYLYLSTFTSNVFKISLFFIFISDWLEHTILPSSGLRFGRRHCVLRQSQRWRTVLQPHEILHGQYSLSHIYAINGPSVSLYVYSHVMYNLVIDVRFIICFILNYGWMISVISCLYGLPTRAQLYRRKTIGVLKCWIAYQGLVHMHILVS